LGDTGGSVPLGVPEAYWRDYLLLTVLHLTPAEADGFPAVELDFLLQMHMAVVEVQNAGGSDFQGGRSAYY
jgi:hypothetical protein